jgi:hypothetical protein
MNLIKHINRYVFSLSLNSLPPPPPPHPPGENALPPLPYRMRRTAQKLTLIFFHHIFALALCLCSADGSWRVGFWNFGVTVSV